MYQDGNYLQPIGEYSQTICQLQIMMLLSSGNGNINMYIPGKQVQDCGDFFLRTSLKITTLFIQDYTFECDDLNFRAVHKS